MHQPACCKTRPYPLNNFLQLLFDRFLALLNFGLWHIPFGCAITKHFIPGICLPEIVWLTAGEHGIHALATLHS